MTTGSSKIQASINTNEMTLERVSNFRFLGIQITEGLSWTHHTNNTTKLV